MRAEVTKEFKGQPDNAPGERYFVVGEILYGALAERAVADGCAVDTGDAPAKSKAKGK